MFVLVSLAGLALTGCNRGNATTHTAPPRVVRVIRVDSAQPGVSRVSHFTGVVRARTESNLGLRVGGKVVERLVNAGEAVKTGQPLLRLDRTDYQLALQSARAVQKQAELELARVQVLVERRVHSPDALEKAAAAAETSAAQAEQLANQAGYTTLVAEADGIVLSTSAEPGQVVAAGQPVLVLARDGAREAAIDIPESSLAGIRGGNATARLFLNADLNVPATLREISGAADPVTRTYQARYVLEAESARFPLGATVTVRISAAEAGASTTTEIPLGSLLDRGDGAAVWVVDPKTSVLVKRPVAIARLGAETASISQGLHSGDLVVSLGAHMLNSGEMVRMETPAGRNTR